MATTDALERWIRSLQHWLGSKFALRWPNGVVKLRMRKAPYALKITYNFRTIEALAAWVDECCVAASAMDSFELVPCNRGVIVVSQNLDRVPAAIAAIMRLTWKHEPTVIFSVEAPYGVWVTPLKKTVTAIEADTLPDTIYRPDMTSILETVDEACEARSGFFLECDNAATARYSTATMLFEFVAFGQFCHEKDEKILRQIRSALKNFTIVSSNKQGRYSVTGLSGVAEPEAACDLAATLIWHVMFVKGCCSTIRLNDATIESEKFLSIIDGPLELKSES